MTGSKYKLKLLPVMEIAQRQPGLGSAIRQAETFMALNRRIIPLLPAKVHGHIRIACIEDDCLMIAAESSVWATQARMLADQMLQQANALWPKPLKRTEVFISAEPFTNHSFDNSSFGNSAED